MESPARITVAQYEAFSKEHLPFAAMYGAEVTEITYGGARIRIPFREDFIRPGGTLNGPLMMAAADLSMYAAVLGAIGLEALAVTTQLSINFLRKPAPATLYGIARMLKLGQKLAVGEVELFTEASPEMVAHAVCTYALPSRPSGRKERHGKL